MGENARQRWKMLAGWAILAIEGFKGLKWLVGAAGDIDFILSLRKDSWAGEMIDFFLDPPGWFSIPAILVGLILIYWDARSRKKREDALGAPPSMRATPEAWSARSAAPQNPDEFSHDAANEASDKEAYYKLMEFCIIHLTPACEAQIILQEKLLDILSENEVVAKYAKDGLRNGDICRAFWDNYSIIDQGTSGSDGTIVFPALIRRIKTLERGAYRSFCDQAGAISETYKTDSRSSPLFTTWANLHNNMVEEYEKIRIAPRFGRLFTPKRQSRWGEKISLPSSSS